MLRGMLSGVFVLALAAGLSFNDTTDAKADQWGCEVLLCAASSEPSWRAISACHPPMNRLISAMRQPGFSWPTCPEAGTGGPGYEKYADCPPGWSAATSGDDGVGGSRGEADVCARETDSCGATLRPGEHCQQIETMPRPLRSKPYYFDIASDDGTVTRHWFDLAR